MKLLLKIWKWCFHRKDLNLSWSIKKLVFYVIYEFYTCDGSSTKGSRFKWRRTSSSSHSHESTRVRYRYYVRMYLGVYAHAYRTPSTPSKSRGNANACLIAAACSNSDSPMRASGRALIQWKIISVNSEVFSCNFIFLFYYSL